MIFIIYIIIYIFALSLSYIFYMPIEIEPITTLTAAPINETITAASITVEQLQKINNVINLPEPTFFQKHKKKIIIGVGCILVAGVIIYFKQDITNFLYPEPEKVVDEKIVEVSQKTAQITEEASKQITEEASKQITEQVMTDLPDRVIFVQKVQNKILSYNTPRVEFNEAQNEVFYEYLLRNSISKTGQIKQIINPIIPNYDMCIDLSKVFFPEGTEQYFTFADEALNTFLSAKEAFVTICNGRILHLFSITTDLYSFLSDEDKTTIMEAYFDIINFFNS